MPDNRVKVVLDTNIFVAAYWASNSASSRIIQACINGSLLAIYTEQVQREVFSVLRQIKIPLDYLEPFWALAEKVKAVKVDDVRIEDPDDRKFLEAAVGGEADFLVTNDDHLLSVSYIGRTEILTPGSFVRITGV